MAVPVAGGEGGGEARAADRALAWRWRWRRRRRRRARGTGWQPRQWAQNGAAGARPHPPRGAGRRGLRLPAGSAAPGLPGAAPPAGCARPRRRRRGGGRDGARVRPRPRRPWPCAGPSRAEPFPVSVPGRRLGWVSWAESAGGGCRARRAEAPRVGRALGPGRSRRRRAVPATGLRRAAPLSAEPDTRVRYGSSFSVAGKSVPGPCGERPAAPPFSASLPREQSGNWSRRYQSV